MPDIVITPNRGTSSNPKIDFTGTSAGTIKLEVLADGAIAWNGANGSLFGISDSLSGSLMSVNDISGLPAFEVFSDNRVIVGQFGARLGIGTVNPSSSSKLHIAGLNTAPPNIFLQTTNSAANGGIFWRNNNNATTSAISSNYNISDSSGNIEFLTNTTSTRMVITSGGNVGINVTQPGAKLEVGGEIYGWATVLSYSQNAGTISTFRNPNAGSSAYSSIYLGNDTAANKLVMFVNSSTRTADGGAGNTTIRTDTGNLILGAAGTTRMIMDGTATYISGNTQFPFDNTDSDQWPVIRFGPNSTTAPKWDEGIIKGSSSRGVFAKQHMGIHFHEDRSFAFHTSGWDTEMEINGDGKIYMKGPVSVNTSNFTGGFRFSINAGQTAVNQGIPASSGTTQNGILRLNAGFGTYGEVLDFGFNVATSYGWIQATNYTDLSTGYNLFLNPRGGNIGIGKLTASHKLDVDGTINSTRLNVAGYTMRSSATIDMSNTGTYSTSNFYPVTIPLSGYAGSHAMPIRMRILNSLNSNVPSWSTHGSGFTCHVEWTTNGSGWGTIAVQRAIHRYTEGYTNSTICGGISQLTNDSIEVIWLRGGGIYYFEADADVTPTPRSTNYTAPNGETANVVSVAVNNVIESARDTRPSFQRLNLTQSAGTAPMTVSSTTLVTNLNADLLDGLNSATANTASTIVARDASGFINATAIQTSSGGANGVRVHSNSGITASGNYMNLFSSQTNGWAFNANGTGADANTVATISASGNANINGIIGTSGGKLSLGILDINSSVTPSYIKINTTIPAGSTSSDFTVTIKGFYYNGARSMEIRVSWHYYLSQFWNACATSSGGWAPEIKLSEEGGFVKITLTSPGYWPKLFVESVYSSAYGSSYSTGWSWTDAAATNSPVTVIYVSDFGNSNYAFTSGLYATNFVDASNSNYWCDPNGTSILRNIQIGPASGGGPGLISIWEAESLNNTGGAINSDASASSGQNWGTSTNTQLYGPYVNLPRGNYRFTARIKVADASYTGNSVRMQVLPIASKVVSPDRYIRGVDFSGNDVWETFSIPFKVIASTSSDVEFYVFGLNSKQIYVDYIAIFLDTDSLTQQVWGNLYANGNVGIGTTTPNYKLELSGTVGLSGFSGGSYRKLATPSYWGYNNAYKSIILGSSSTTYNTNDGAVTLCFGVDISGNASGSFTGDGRELVFRNLTRFVTPNGSNDNYLNPLTFNNGNVGIAIDSPSFKFQVAGAGSIGDGAFIVSGNTASSSFYDQNTGAYNHTPGAMIRKDSSRTTPQTSEATLVLYNKNGTDATNTKLVFANNETTSTSANPVATAAIVSEKVSGTAGGWAVGNLQFLVKNGANYTNSVVVDNTGVTVAGALTVQDGTESTNIFGLKTFTKSLTVTTSWSDVGISGSDLATGTYIIQVTVDNYDVSGGQYQERYSGVMSWIAGGTNSTDVDEIVLHKAGHAPNGNWINLRTVRQLGSGAGVLKLQIIASGNTSAADNYVFKFRRMI